MIIESSLLKLFSLKILIIFLLFFAKQLSANSEILIFSIKLVSLDISSAKPPIFWKDKEITKQQIYKWSPESIKNLIYKLSNLEFFSKKNLNNSLKLVSDFIIEVSLSKTNS